MVNEYKLEISNSIKKSREESIRNNTRMPRWNPVDPIDNLIYSLDNLLDDYE